MTPALDTSTDTSPEQPPANMETLMSQLGAAKANTTIVGSATHAAAQEPPTAEAQASS